MVRCCPRAARWSPTTGRRPATGGRPALRERAKCAETPVEADATCPVHGEEPSCGGVYAGTQFHGCAPQRAYGRLHGTAGTHKTGAPAEDLSQTRPGPPDAVEGDEIVPRPRCLLFKRCHAQLFSRCCARTGLASTCAEMFASARAADGPDLLCICWPQRFCAHPRASVANPRATPAALR